MGDKDTLHESPQEGINIAKLAQELGVDESCYTYSKEDIEKSQAIFEYFCQNIKRDDQDHISIDSEVTMRISELFSEVESIPYLPLFLPPINDIESWKKSLFFDVWVTFIICRSIQLRIGLLQNLQESGIFLPKPAHVVGALNDVEIFNTFGSIFHNRVKKFLEQQPTFRRLKEQILPLEDWYDEQMRIAEEKKVPEKLFRKADKDFWSDDKLPVAKLFISNRSTYEMDPREFVCYLDRFLCHSGNEYFRLIAGGIKSEKSGYIPRWKAWLYARRELFLTNNFSEAERVFAEIFGINGRVMENEALTQEASNKLPLMLVETFENILAQHKKAQKKLKKVVASLPVSETHQVVSRILPHASIVPAKEVVIEPDLAGIFGDVNAFKNDKKQLESINLLGLTSFPPETQAVLEYTIPGKKQSHVLECALGGITTIPLEIGKDIRGPWNYILTFTLPQTHIFQSTGSRILKVVNRWYAEAPWTDEEKAEEQDRLERLSQKLKSSEKTVPVVAEQVEQKVERVIDPVGVSLTAVAMVLDAQKNVYSEQKYSGGPITITLTDDIVDVLGDDVKTVLPGHKQWIIEENDSITPAVSDTDVNALLMDIVHTLRTKYQTEQQARDAALQQQRELEEYENARKEFEPILTFAKAFKFEGREKGNFEYQKGELREQLRRLGWSIPVVFAGSQILWRHSSANIKILYASKMCSSFIVEAEAKGNITPATQKCYEEVAEAFAHIARFFNAETRERKKMITREQAIRKETETGAIAYEKLLTEGRARLVLYDPYQGSYGAWSSKFPTEKKPHMLDERASHATIASILEQYPHAELCYRRDQLCINGEVADDAGDESVENTLQNIADLRQSPRARYILTKRILITLGLEKFGGDTLRAPIKHEKNKKEGRFSALDVLHHLRDMWVVHKNNLPDSALVREKIRQEGYGYKLYLDSRTRDDSEGTKSFYEMTPVSEETTGGDISAADIDKEFIDTYIDILELFKIRVHYVWPLSARLDEHQKIIKKSVARSAESVSTAD